MKKLIITGFLLARGAALVSAQSIGPSFSLHDESFGGDGLAWNGIEYVTVGTTNGIQTGASPNFSIDDGDASTIDYLDTITDEVVHDDMVTGDEVSRVPVKESVYLQSPLTSIPNQSGTLDSFTFNYALDTPSIVIVFDFLPSATPSGLVDRLEGFENDFELWDGDFFEFSSSLLAANGIGGIGTYQVNALLLDTSKSTSSPVSYPFQEESFTLTVTAVPEPSSYAAILGMIGLTVALIRRSNYRRTSGVYQELS